MAQIDYYELQNARWSPINAPDDTIEIITAEVEDGGVQLYVEMNFAPFSKNIWLDINCIVKHLPPEMTNLDLIELRIRGDADVQPVLYNEDSGSYIFPDLIIDLSDDISEKL